MASLLGTSFVPSSVSIRIPSNFRVSQRLPLPIYHFGSAVSPPRRRRHSALSSFAVGHEAELWVSVERHIWLLLSPFVVVAPLLALNSRWQEGGPPLELLGRFFGSIPRSQEIERSVVQFTMVLLLSAAAKSNMSAPDPYNYYENVPPDISDQQVRKRIQRPKSPKAERCTQKCVGTCILGGAGAPGEGPLNVRKPLVVFKEGFRTRQYCLVECSEICNLIEDGKDGP